MVSNFVISSNSISAVAGDTILLAGLGAQAYKWTDIDNNIVLGTDSVLIYAPNRPVANISLKYGKTGGCLDSAKVKILWSAAPADTVPPTFVTVDTLLTGKKSGDTLTTFNCNKPIYFSLNSVKITDNLDTNPTLTLDSTIVNGNCPVDGYLTLKTYTWTGRDSLGNTSIFRIFIKITDKTPPVLSGVPNNIIISQLDNIPNANVTATDNCTSVTLTLSLIFTGMNGNDSVFVRQWIATDACGNMTRDSQIIVKRGYSTPSVSVHRDTILVGDTVVYCLSNLNISGTINNIVNTCPTTSNRHVSYTFDASNCLIMKGLSIGVDTACLTICTDSSYCVQVKFITDVRVSIVDSVKVTVEIGKSDTVCLKTTGLKGTTFTVTNICADTTNKTVEYTVYNTTCIIIKGVLAGTVKSCWVVCDSTGRCDTTIITTKVNPPKNDTVRVTINTGKNDTICLKTSGLVGKNFTLTNTCSNPLNTSVGYEIIKDSCIVIKGLASGTDKSCWTLCDSTGKCVTTIIFTTITDPSVINRFDTISIGNSAVYCLSQLNFKGKIKTILNNCFLTSNRNVTYTLNAANCIVMKGIRIGTDTACFTVCTDSAECKTVNLYTTVLPHNDSINVVVNVGQSDTICFKINRPHTIPIRNICPDSTVVQFQILGDTCVIIKGVAVGKGKACWVICDTLGVCDTIIVNVTVGGALLPIADDDTASTLINTMVTIQVLQNDTINGKLNKITLMTEPRYGTAVLKDVNGQWHVEYKPKENFCSSKYIDEFMYEICNDNGCDMAMIRVKTICDGLVIYNGFTPNGDGKNDFFTVEGIENFPNTRIIIYNRWGNRIYEEGNYQNNWGGTWNDLLVPDGTYFYQVILEKGDIYSGYLQIHH